jgi:hypothetical protein
MNRKPRGRRELGRPRYKWQDNVNIDLKEIRCEHVDDCVHLAQDRVLWQAFVNTIKNILVPKKARYLLVS